MKIIKLVAENIKRLSAVEIQPDGNLVEITGKNGAGKSSVLDSIWWALAGTRHHQQRPIRDGQVKARIELDLGELIVHRGFSERPGGNVTTSLSVEAADADGPRRRLSSPQKVLDALLSSIAFDPLAFARMAPRDQYGSLTELCGIDLDTLERENQKAYAKRTEVNRKAKERGASARLIVVPSDTPADPVNVTALVQELEDAHENNREIESGVRDVQDTRRTAERERANAEAKVDRANRMVSEAQAKRDDAAALIAEAATLEDSASKWIVSAETHEAEAMATHATADSMEAAIPAPVDIQPIQQRLTEADGINRAVAARDQKEALLEETRELEQQASGITREMDNRTADMRKLVEDADLPVDGLTLERGVVLYRRASALSGVRCRAAPDLVCDRHAFERQAEDHPGSRRIAARRSVAEAARGHGGRRGLSGLDRAGGFVRQGRVRDRGRSAGGDPVTTYTDRDAMLARLEHNDRRRPHEGLLTWLMGKDVFLCRQDKSTGYEKKGLSWRETLALIDQYLSETED